MILITGASGFLGHALCRLLNRAGEPYIGVHGRVAWDLRDPERAQTCINGAVRGGVETVVHLAYPRTDGILTSVLSPADLAHDGLLIDLNVMRACANARVKKLICMGTVCSYPRVVTFPTNEAQLFLGTPEQTNGAYGHAKRMQGVMLEAYAHQKHLPFTQLILSNLYGPGEASGHVIPATIRKVLEARRTGAPFIEAWGDGTATREFLYVADAADAIFNAIIQRPMLCGMNICSGSEIQIKFLVGAIMEYLDYRGEVRWDLTKPVGQPRRQFSYQRARTLLNWAPATDFLTGLHRTIDAMKGSPHV